MEIIDYLKLSDKAVSVIEDCGSVNPRYSGFYITLPKENYQFIRQFLSELDATRINYYNKVFEKDNFQFIKDLLLASLVVIGENSFTEMFIRKYGDLRLDNSDLVDDTYSEHEEYNSDFISDEEYSNDFIDENAYVPQQEFIAEDTHLTEQINELQEENESLRLEVESIRQEADVLNESVHELNLIREVIGDKSIEEYTNDLKQSSEEEIASLRLELDKYKTELEEISVYQTDMKSAELEIERLTQELKKQQSVSEELIERLKDPQYNSKIELIDYDSIAGFYKTLLELDPEKIKVAVLQSVEDLTTENKLRVLTEFLETIVNKLISTGGIEVGKAN